MYKHIVTLFRGRAHSAAESLVDQNALLILKQQIRDASNAIATSRKAVASAIAHHEQERGHYNNIVTRIKDLEVRATAALENGKDELAIEAAETIAALEDEKTASETAQKRYAAKISQLKKQVQTAQAELRNLQRGERLASATEYTQKLDKVQPQRAQNSLRDAKETLARLEDRQKHTELARTAEQEIESATHPIDITERMADAGCGTPLKSSADSVLERLKAKSAATKSKKAK